MEQIQEKPTGGVFPKFILRLVIDPIATKEAGHDVHKEIEWVELFIVGDKFTKPSRKISDDDKQRWPNEYKAFIEGTEAPLKGTAITEWSVISRSRAADLQSMRIRTVEDLANLGDDAIQRIGMGARDLVAKAKMFLESQDTNADLKKENNELREQLNALAEKVEAMSKPKTKKKITKKEAA